MQRVIDEMAKAKSDVEKRYREKIPEIIRECMAFAYLGKTFTFSINEDLEKRVNQRFIELSDEILSDIETRAKRAIRYADEEEDEDAILAYMKREQGGEDLITRIDKHNSNFRYFLEGWIAIGMVNGISQTNLLTNILTFMNNVYVSDLWQKAFNEGYLSNAIRTRGYHFGKGILRNPMEALTEVSRHSINEAFQYGRFMRYQKDGAIGYTIHRNSGFDCPYCDSFTEIVHPMTACLLPLHPRCVCYSKPVYANPTQTGIQLQKLKTIAKGKSVLNKPQPTINPLIIERESRYKALLNNPDYKDVVFDKNTGGLKASHVNHNFASKGSAYEINVQNVGFKYGHEVILESEPGDMINKRYTEGTWDGMQFEVAGRETGTENNVLRGLKHCAEKRNTEIAILYYPNNNFDLDIFNNALSRYIGLEKLNDGQFLKFKKILCIQGDEIMIEIDF